LRARDNQADRRSARRFALVVAVLTIVLKLSIALIFVPH